MRARIASARVLPCACVAIMSLSPRFWPCSERDSLEEPAEADPRVLLGERLLGRADELLERVLEDGVDEILFGAKWR